MRRLIDARSLDFTRYVEQDLDDNYELVDSAIGETITAKGSLQPYEQDNTSGAMPEGRDATTAYVFHTKTLLQYAERRNQIEADTTIIRGRDYEVFPYEDWSVDFDVEAKGKIAYRTYLLVEVEETN